MKSISFHSICTCARCLCRNQPKNFRRVRTTRGFSASTPIRNEQKQEPVSNGEQVSAKLPHETQEPGAMSRQLEDLTEQSVLEGGSRSAKKIMEDGGFSRELKAKLEAKIEAVKFKRENAAAFTVLDMPVMFPLPMSDSFRS